MSIWVVSAIGCSLACMAPALRSRMVSTLARCRSGSLERYGIGTESPGRCCVRAFMNRRKQGNTYEEEEKCSVIIVVWN